MYQDYVWKVALVKCLCTLQCQWARPVILNVHGYVILQYSHDLACDSLVARIINALMHPDAPDSCLLHLCQYAQLQVTRSTHVYTLHIVKRIIWILWYTIPDAYTTYSYTHACTGSTLRLACVFLQDVCRSTEEQTADMYVLYTYISI